MAPQMKRIAAIAHATTTVIHPGNSAWVDDFGNLVISIA